MLVKANLPLDAKLADLVLRTTQLVGLNLIPIRPDRLISEAEARVPGERVDDRAREILPILCDSMEGIDFNIVGRRSIQYVIIRALVARMRLHKMQREQPEIFETELRDPLIVIGLARSGTTFLHRLLCNDPNAKGFAHYEFTEPIPAEPDRRRERAAAEVAWVKRTTPDLDKIHHVGVDEPSECFPLLNPSLLSPGFVIAAPCMDYIRWFSGQDVKEAYRYYRAFLQLFQYQNPEKRLTLKSPVHLYGLRALSEVVPEARLVQTHRPPQTTVCSMASLKAATYSMTVRSLDPQVIMKFCTESVGRILERNESDRVEPVRAGRLFDVPYERLRTEPLSAVHDIYDFFGFPWTPEVEQSIGDYVRSNPQNKHGKHRYDPADFGVSQADLEREFFDYSPPAHPASPSET